MQTNDRSVSCRMCFSSGVHSFASPQRFLFCLSPYLFSEWHIVPQLCVQIKQSRVDSRKALAECKASRRLGKHIRGLYMFLLKPTLQQFLPLKLILCHKTQKGGCPRLFILHIRLCLYSFYEAISSLHISHNPSFVFLLSEYSSRHSTCQTMLTTLSVSNYHSTQNACPPATVAVYNNGVVYMSY